MQTTNRFFDELSRVMTGAAGAAKGLREEVEQLVRSQAERVANDLDLVSREEFEAVRALAAAGIAEREALTRRVAALEAELAALKKGGARARPAGKSTQAKAAPRRAARKKS
ncbi:MAG: accessory factor UbiK family protein [Alphaproteobacteria bacterium]|nr:accessory factor UbiK family protein [Alphaproteobacteria bacterium]